MSMVEGDAHTLTRRLTDDTRPFEPVDDIDLLRQVEVGLFGTPTAPIVVGRYALLRMLGRGGFGRVYEADDPELARRVAVKLVDVAALPLGADADGFRVEARALARARHPHCVTIFDVGSYDLVGEARHSALATGVPPTGIYIVMELVRGQQLATWLQQPRSVGAVLDVFEQLAGALAAAHAVGVIHGDFKPGNVVVDATGHAQVLDFGLARLLDPGAHAQDDVATDRIIGTPRYMAPEQLEGVRATARSDQYSWAASLYEAIGGVLPEHGATFETRAPSESAGDPPRPRRFPRWLARVVERAMATSPG